MSNPLKNLTRPLSDFALHMRNLCVRWQKAHSGPAGNHSHHFHDVGLAILTSASELGSKIMPNYHCTNMYKMSVSEGDIAGSETASFQWTFFLFRSIPVHRFQMFPGISLSTSSGCVQENAWLTFCRLGVRDPLMVTMVP